VFFLDGNYCHGIHFGLRVARECREKMYLISLGLACLVLLFFDDKLDGGALKSYLFGTCLDRSNAMRCNVGM
jgi:hypothetical protein